MHIILTQQEINEYIKRYLDIPSDVEVTVSLAPEDMVKEPHQNTDGWIVNTRTEKSHPLELNEFENIQVEFTDKAVCQGVAACWGTSCDTNHDPHIVKYRKL